MAKGKIKGSKHGRNIMVITRVLFFLSFIIIIWIYAGYPLILTVIVFFKEKPHQKKEIYPYATLVVPVYNEEKIIQRKIRNSLFLDYPKGKLEVIFVLDGCTDRSRNIAQKYINQGVNVIEQNIRRGKMAALNAAVAQAKGDILVFSDANAMYEKDTVKKLVRNFADEKIGCVCGELKYIGVSTKDEGENLYWKYEKFLKIKESQLQSVIVVNGPIYAMRKKLFEPIDKSLADDFVNPMIVANKNYGVVYEHEAQAKERIAEKAGEEFSRKIRIISQGIKASFAMRRIIFSSHPLRILQLVFHKLLRWWVFLFMMVIFISNIFLLDYWFYRVTFSCQLMFYMAAFTGYVLAKKEVKIKLFNIPFYFCMVNLASFVGILKFLTKNIEATWEKAESTRI